MEYIAPLLQTVLWVGLLGVVLRLFHKPIHDLLITLQKRIESGSNIKAGPFELTEQFKPQDPSQQREKAALEIDELMQEQRSEQVQQLPEGTSRKALALKAKYFQAEDLVLRAIQTEYGATVERNVMAGSDIGFDGAFVSNGRLNIVEVKYLARPSSNFSNILKSVDRIEASITRYGWRNVQILLAIVVESAEDVAKVSTGLKEKIARKQDNVEVVIRCYTFAELRQKFGVEGTT